MSANIKYELNQTYSDINTDFSQLDKHNDISLIVDDISIKNSIRNIVMSNWSELPFKEKFGCNLSGLLGDNSTNGMVKFIRDIITDEIKNNESRIELDSVVVTFDESKLTYYVLIIYIINKVSFTFEITLK